MTSPLLPGDHPTPRSLLPVTLLTAVLAAAGVVVAVLLGPEPARGAVGTTGTVAALLLCAAVTWAAHAAQAARALRVRLETANVDVDRLIQERTRQAEEARRQHERLTGELTRERARLSAELDQERARLSQSLAAERDRLHEQHSITVERLTQEHTAERSRLTGDHTAERARLTEQHTAEIARLTDDHTASLARLADEHTAALARLADEHTGELRRRDEEHASRTAALVQEHADERDRLAQVRDRLSEERDRLSRDRDRHIDENARLAVRLREANSARAAALSATANVAGRMQALSTGMLADLRAMEEKHHDEEVLADLLHLDHRTAQAGRLADSVAVLTGARSGRRWARPIGMESILRGAMGRINGYQRIRVHSASDTAVAGHAAEGVMHAVAELLDNAANFSPPTAEVHVYVEEVPAGVIVSVEDSGLVMGEAQLRRAERAVSGETAGLGGLTGTRLGLAVVGRLARRYGLTVSYRPSARGGTGVLMLIPQDLLVPVDATPRTPSAVTAAPAPSPSLPAARTAPATAPARPAPSTADAPSGETARTAPAVPGEPSGPTLPRRRGSRPDGAPAAHPADGTAPGRNHTAPGTSRTTPSGTVPAPRDPAARAASRTTPPAGTTGHSYAASRAGAGDLDPDPVPTHGSAGRDTDAPPLNLPRRSRGRTLAEAERTRGTSRADAPPKAPPTAEETKARTARFSSFRQAVRATATEPCAGPAPAPATDATGTDSATGALGADTDTDTKTTTTTDTATATEAPAETTADAVAVADSGGTAGTPAGDTEAITSPSTPTPATPEGDTTS
ncbi:ATP-binding protein [Streptomyces prasinus]|uniref:ATP-binding protein n=1 Tax=Streptomyces prasinus TaxID=67345 RepID=UPI00381C754F